jgi:hypothetical protein
MTRRWSKGMAGEKFLGNKDKKEIHNLDKEKPECGIDAIVKAEFDIAFRTLEDAHNQGYQDCPFCILEEDDSVCKI